MSKYDDEKPFFQLEADQWNVFTAALEATPKENPKLKRLLALHRVDLPE